MITNMTTNKDLEKRIETLEKEVQHLKAILQYQIRNKKKWFIIIALHLLIIWLEIYYLALFMFNIYAESWK